MLFSFITTKPGSRHGPSIKNPRVYDALRREGYSKSAAAAISNAQRRRKKSLPFRVKAPNYGARAGQTIGGRLVRGNDGKFASGGGAAPAAKPKRKPKVKPVKPKVTPEQRAAAREQERIARRDAVLAQLGIDPGASEALVMLSNGEQPDPAALARMGASEAGLVEQAADGSYRMTPAGRQMLNAAERGDKGLAGDVISRARDRIAAQAEKPVKPAAAGGGGGGKKKPEKPPKLPARQTSQAPKPVSGGGGAAKPPAEKPEAKPATDPALAALAQRLSAGEELTEEEQDALIRNGLARMVRGELVLTMAGQRATRTKEGLTRFSGETPWDAIVNDNSLDIEEEQALIDRLAPFHVYKDRAGRLRWVAYSSNAYRDRDEEIVSTKALTDDCARADAAKAYGPLRWWHVPGWELGACDFNAMHGRVLVESGTFKSDSIGRAVAAKAAQLQLSIGFTHAPDEPDRSGVFHHIQRFERSLVPNGRAANPFTKLSVVKESDMDNEKETVLKTVLGEEVATQVIAGAEAVQKDADDRQTAFKSADDPWAAVLTTLKAAVATMVAPPAPEPEPIAEKAPPPVVEEEVVAEEPALIEGQAMDDMGGGEMSADEFLAQIGALIDAKLAPIAGLLDIEKKVSGAVQSLMQPYQAQKDASDAERAEEIATLKAKIAELEGEQPAAWRAPWGGYRASADAATIATKEQVDGLDLPPLDADPEWTKIQKHLIGNGHLTS